MGMYDELICRYPLPDGFDSGTRRFQTKDTPAQWLEIYELRVDGMLVHLPRSEDVAGAPGTLLDESQAEVLPFEGELTFYTGNGCGWGPWGFMTDDDQAAWWAEYTAVFAGGRLVSLTGAKTLEEDTGRPHLTRVEWHRQHRLWGEERDRHRQEEHRHGC